MTKLKQLRIDSGKSMADVAKALKIPYSTYVNYEKGTREPNSEMLITLADYYGVSIDYIIGRTESKDVKPKDEVERKAANIALMYMQMDEHGREIVEAVAKIEHRRSVNGE